MDALKDLLDAIRIGITERITSPLIGTFITSWLICNYRILMTIFGDLSTTQKFSLLNEQIYEYWWQIPYIFGMPALITWFYIFAYPKIAEPVYRRRLEAVRNLATIRQKIEDETPLTIEASRKIRFELLEQRTEMAKRVEEYERDLEAVRSELKKRELPKIESPNVVVEAEKISRKGKGGKQQAISKIDEVSPRPFDKLVLGAITKIGSGGALGVTAKSAFDYITQLTPPVSTTHLRVLASFDNLVKGQYISVNQETAWLTPTGRQFVIANDLDTVYRMRNLVTQIANKK